MAKRKNQPAFPDGVGRLVLHRFCGDEVYVVTEAEMLAYHHEDRVRLWFDAATRGTCVQAQTDTGPYNPRPKVSIRVHIPSLVATELVGQRFAPTDREPNGDPPASIFYFETDELHEPVVEVLGRKKAVFDVRITGTCTDVNYYDGSKPPTRVEQTGRFTFAKVSDWES